MAKSSHENDGEIATDTENKNGIKKENTRKNERKSATEIDCKAR